MLQLEKSKFNHIKGLIWFFKVGNFYSSQNSIKRAQNTNCRMEKDIEKHTNLNEVTLGVDRVTSGKADKRQIMEVSAESSNLL